METLITVRSQGRDASASSHRELRNSDLLKGLQLRSLNGTELGVLLGQPLFASGLALSLRPSLPRFMRSPRSGLTVNGPVDPVELEADRVAQQVRRMPERMKVQRKCAACQQEEKAQRKCTACEKEEESHKLARKETGAGPRVAPPFAQEVLGSSGEPLDAGARAFMEPRFGHDFSRVRVHTDDKAAASARAVSAEAYTVGNHIVFATQHPERRLLAHELAHTLQQPASCTVRRKLSVDPNQPANAPVVDPAASLTSGNRFSMMNTVIQTLCPRFQVDGACGEVVSTIAHTLNRAELATGDKAIGCCCLSILTDATTQWTIEVSGLIGAQTDDSGHQVFLNPTNIPVEFGAFTAGNKLAFQGAVSTAGHELCGHAALMEIGAHPPSADRLTTNVHDPTVRIENLISQEQGVPSRKLRGLAAAGSHRGESVDKITIQNYPFNETDIPPTELTKIQFAAEYIHTSGPTTPAQDEYVSILGHSDGVGSSEAKQFVSDERARKVKDALIAQGVPATITEFGLPTASRFTRVAGLSDTQPPPAPLRENAANWRRVEILMSAFPAGAQTIPAGTPSGVAPAPLNPSVAGLRTSSDPCISKLVTKAYP